MENAHVESITSETREIRLNEPAFASLNEMRKWTERGKTAARA